MCSINFHPHTPLVSVGNSMGSIGLYDLERRALVRTIAGHQKRVSSLSFSNVLYSGSKDSQILCHDIKLQNSIVGRFTNHKGEVCGLSHSPSGLVSGSNDNTAMIWDLNMGRLRHTLTGHKGAVKALAWCPWQRNLLATGGGSKDKCIKFWNIDTGRCVNTVNAESQVSSLIWNPNEKELLSAHGFSNNQLSLWKVHCPSNSVPRNDQNLLTARPQPTHPPSRPIPRQIDHLQCLCRRNSTLLEGVLERV